MAQPEVGAQFAGYRIESLVGRGGMGVVYRALQLDLGRTVALKLIAPEALEDEAAREHFVTEARHAASIEHPNVVPIYAAGEHDGLAYFVMRFVEGDDLRTRVRRDGPLAPLGAAAIVQSAGAALDAIHRAGLVHRDVKPANILLGEGDHVYLTDFGLARVALARESTRGSGRWAGSLHYAAPEQIRGGRVDARADVYALGGVLVFMLTGKVPFARDSDEATLWAHVADPPPRPSELRRGLPGSLDDVVARAMAKRPEDRFASAGDLGRAALAAAEGRRAPRRRGQVAVGAASPSGALALPGLTDDAPTLTAAVAPPRAPGRGRVLAGALAAAVVLALGVAALVSRGGGSDDRAVTQGTPTPTPTLTPTPTATPAGPRVARIFRNVLHRPNAIVRVGDQLWVTSASAPLMRLGALTGRPREHDAAVVTGGKSLSAHGDRVWVANANTHTVTALRAAPPHAVIVTVPQPGKPMRVAADDTGGVWVSVRSLVAGGPDTAIHYDAAGNQLYSKSVRNGIGAIALSPRALWISQTRVAKIMRIDRRSGAAHNFVLLPRVSHEIAWGDGYLWASSQEDNTLTRVGPHPGVLHTTAAGHRPEQIAFAGGRIFVASFNDQTLLVINPRTLKTERALTVPFNPFAVTADARHVWVSGLGDDTITRVDL